MLVIMKTKQATQLLDLGKVFQESVESWRFGQNIVVHEADLSSETGQFCTLVQLLRLLLGSP